MKQNLPVNPRPNEVWENNLGERRFVVQVTSYGEVRSVSTVTNDLEWWNSYRWSEWVTTTNAKCILSAEKQTQQESFDLTLESLERLAEKAKKRQNYISQLQKDGTWTSSV